MQAQSALAVQTDSEEGSGVRSPVSGARMQSNGPEESLPIAGTQLSSDAAEMAVGRQDPQLQSPTGSGV